MRFRRVRETALPVYVCPSDTATTHSRSVVGENAKGRMRRSNRATSNRVLAVSHNTRTGECFHTTFLT